MENIQDFLSGFKPKGHAVKELVIDGRKYRLVEDDKPVLDLTEFTARVDGVNCEVDFVYGEWVLASIGADGKLKLLNDLPRNLGLAIDGDGRVIVEHY